MGRIISPGFPGNYSNNLTCHWLLEAPAGHRLHLHFEKVSLAEDDDRFGSRAGGKLGRWGHPGAAPHRAWGHVQGWVLLAILIDGCYWSYPRMAVVGHTQMWALLAIGDHQG